MHFLYILFSFLCSGEYYLGYTKLDLQGVSWYNLLHPDCMKEVQSKHRQSKYIYDAIAYVLFNWLVKLCHIRHLVTCYNVHKKSFYRGKFLVWGSNNRKNYFNHHMHPYVFLSISKILSAHNTLQKLLLKVFRNILTLFYLISFGRFPPICWIFVDIQTNSLKDVFCFYFFNVSRHYKNK